MAYAVFQQKDGRFAVWSTITDSYIVFDATPEEVAKCYVRRATGPALMDADRALKVAKGEKSKPFLYPEPEYAPEEANQETGYKLGGSRS